jgi:hypothetical protein
MGENRQIHLKWKHHDVMEAQNHMNPRRSNHNRSRSRLAMVIPPPEACMDSFPGFFVAVLGPLW